MKKSDLVAAAKEMNDVMGLKPAIKATAKEDALVKDILKNADHPEDGVVANDEFSDETWAVLAELGNKVACEKTGVEPEEDPKEEDPETETALEDMDLDELKAYIEEEELDIKVKKSARAPAVLKLILAAQEEPEEELEPEEDPEPEETAAEKKKRLKKEKAAAKGKDTPAPKKSAERDAFGRRVGTKVAACNALLKTGKHTEESVIEELAGQDLKMTAGALKTHMASLKSEGHDITIGTKSLKIKLTAAA